MQDVSRLIALVTETERALVDPPKGEIREKLLDQWGEVGLRHLALELFRAFMDSEAATLQTALARSLYEAAGASVGAVTAVTLALPGGGAAGEVFHLLRRTATLVSRTDQLRNLIHEAERAVQAAEQTTDVAVDAAHLRLAGAQAEAAKERAATVVVDLGIEAAVRGYRERLVTELFSEAQRRTVREQLERTPLANFPGWHYVLRARLRHEIDESLCDSSSATSQSLLSKLLVIGVLSDIVRDQARAIFARRFCATCLPGVLLTETAFRVRRAFALEAETADPLQQSWLLHVTGLPLSPADLESFCRSPGSVAPGGSEPVSDQA